MNSSGQIVLSNGTTASTIAGAGLSTVPAGNFPIGYVVLQYATATALVNPAVLDANIHQFTRGGGATAGANSDITSLTGLTTALSVGQGGTGVTSSTGTGANVLGTGPTLSTPQINSALLIQEIATPSNPGAGFDKLYTKSDGILYKLDSSGNEVPVGSGTGSGEINAVLNPSAGTNTSGWTAATNYSVSKDTSNSPLSPVTSTSLAMSTTTLSAESSTSGIYYSISTLPAGLTNKKLKVECYVTTPASSAGTWKLSIYAGSTRLALTTDSPVSTTLPAGFTGKFVAYFDATNATAYSVNFTQTARTSANTMYVTNVIVGPGIQPQGAVVSAWQAYTPTIAGVTTSANVAQYRRVGDSVEIEGSFTASGTSTALVTASLPSGLTINTSALAKGGTADDTLGNGIYSAATITQIYVTYGGSNTVSFGGQGNTARYGATVTVASPNAVDYRCIVPVNEWAGSGTVQLAQNDVEYAWNSSTTDANDTSSFGYGPNGASFINLTATRTKTVQFQTPIQPSDKIFLEWTRDGGVTWHDVAQSSSASSFATYTLQNVTDYGFGLQPSGNSTQIVVEFGRYRQPTGATYGATGTDWSGIAASSTFKWRVRKSSAGAAVGFGIVVPGTSSGLVSASGLPGNTTGNAISAGYVGQVITWTTPPATTSVTTTTFADWTNATFTLTPGIWLICASVAAKIVPPSSAGLNTYLSLQLYDATNSAQIAYKALSCGASTSSAGSVTNASLAFYNTVNLTSSTQYKLRYSYSGSLGTVLVYNETLSTSEFFAVRIA
jgi:hypothetical protein